MCVNKSKTIGQLKVATTNILLETCENVMKNTIEGSKNCGLLFCLKVINNGDQSVISFILYYIVFTKFFLAALSESFILFKTF